MTENSIGLFISNLQLFIAPHQSKIQCCRHTLVCCLTDPSKDFNSTVKVLSCGGGGGGGGDVVTPDCCDDDEDGEVSGEPAFFLEVGVVGGLDLGIEGGLDVGIKGGLDVGIEGGLS